MLKIWIHAVWSTKRRAPVLSESLRREVFNHIIKVGRRKGFLIDRVNGYVDHVHVLFALRSTQRIAEILHHIKGESSRFINYNQLTDDLFEWQSDYFACSVSEYGLEKVRKYIDDQEEHHRSMPYKKELKGLTSDPIRP